MNTKTIAGTGVFLALTIVFTFISNYVAIGPASFNLALVPIALAGIFFGPVSGLIVGLANGAIVLLSPSTSMFLSISVGGTIVVCLSKGAIAGLVSGLLFKLIRKKNLFAASITASVIVPILNTSIFIGEAFIFYQTIIAQLMTLNLLINFLVEFGITVILSPTIYHLVKHYQYKKAQEGK